MDARLKIAARGAVQGVGFRPFVYRLATELGVRGWVRNSPQGAFIEAEGPRARLDQFLFRIEAEKPPHCSIQSLECTWLDPRGYTAFEILPSDEGGEKSALVLPDIATCPDCLREIFDPSNRRFRYPFTNCTRCGPRFSILEALPYDRANTSMRRFALCSQCRAEYDDPRDRRFHAQPNACPACGPHLEWWDRAGQMLATHDAALRAAVDAVRRGHIVAVKGLGGFHLLVTAHDDAAVRRLRQRKHREEKPLALMVPTVTQARDLCEVDAREERLLRSPEAPIVLLRRNPSAAAPAGRISEAVAPGNPYLGVMLPYTPLHHLLLAELGCPVVATSGNLSDEPICTDEREALTRLGAIADFFLVHNRPIVRHVDDSVARVLLGREMVLRRARGYAPLPVALRLPATAPARPVGGEPEARTVAPSDAATCAPVTLAVGAHLKNTVALALGSQVFLSQHIGDLETEQSLAAFRQVVEDLPRLYDARPEAVAADLHPDYHSTLFARRLALPLVGVQHHYAHVLAGMAENELEPPVLGVSWDGTGYGPDGTVWGGEFLVVQESSFERFAHLRPFRLPGGELAVKEPRRAALGLLREQFGDAAFSRADLAPVRSFQQSELALLRQALARKLNAPLTSSAGRLFDAVAALAGLRQITRFEGQAAMELEFALEGVQTDEAYPWAWDEGPSPNPPAGRTQPRTPLILDWGPLVGAILADVQRGEAVGRISARFHNALVGAIVTVARRAGLRRVVLTGGCFQNRYLTERAVLQLQAAGFQPYWHQRVPPNDGSIALGQAVAACRAAKLNRPCA